MTYGMVFLLACTAAVKTPAGSGYYANCAALIELPEAACNKLVADFEALKPTVIVPTLDPHKPITKMSCVRFDKIDQKISIEMR
jgi:hypothetical protein